MPFEKPRGVYSTLAFYIILENPRSSIFSCSPIGGDKFINANRRGFKQIRMVNNRRWSAYFINNFARLSTLKPIRAALTSQDLSSYTKFAPTQSRVTLPLMTKCTYKKLYTKTTKILAFFLFIK